MYSSKRRSVNGFNHIVYAYPMKFEIFSLLNSCPDILKTRKKRVSNFNSSTKKTKAKFHIYIDCLLYSWNMENGRIHSGCLIASVSA